MTLPGFTECPECEGGLEYPTPSFSESHPLPVPCPSCPCVGVVPDPETVEAKARELHDIECVPNCPQPLNENWRHYARTTLRAQARAALLAYAQHAKETE